MKKIALFLIAIIALVACNPQIEGGIESLTLTPDAVTLKIGESKKIRTSVTPATDSYTVKWETSNASIATVDTKGNVTAVATGSATITATVDGTDVSSTAAVTVVTPFDALKFYTIALMGSSETPYYIDGVDVNEDGINDDIYSVTFYGLPESMYLQENSLVGDDDYMLIIKTACSVCPLAEDPSKKAIYSLGAYAFSDVEEDYLAVDVDGVPCLKPHMATITHFDEKKYLDVYTLLFEDKSDEANEYVDLNGYWMGDFDSYVAYINFEYQQVVDGGYILAGAFETTNTSYDLSYYAFNLKMFEKPYAYGFATQMGEDPTTGEPVEQFVWPLEMGTMIEKTYTYGEPSSAQPEEVQARAKAFEPVSFEAAKKQIAVNNALYTSLKVAFKK